MSHFFYTYNVFNDEDGVERTLLKFMVNGEFGNSSKIDKPTSELTPEDMEIIQHFIDGGMVVRNKIEIEAPPSDNNEQQIIG